MLKLSQKEFNQIQKQILRENQVRKEIKNVVNKEVELINKKFLDAFDTHPITIEIEAGPRASNISGTLDGVGNLFTYIGFSRGDRPIANLRKLLEKYEVQYHPHEKYIKINIIVPTKQEIFAATPLPWASGRSWADSMERGLSGLGQYLYRDSGVSTSNSGYAAQTKSRLRGGKFRNIRYMSSLLNDYYKELRKLESKRF